MVSITKDEKIGKKILVTGNGRCNLTNKIINKDSYNQDLSNFFAVFNNIQTIKYKTDTEYDTSLLIGMTNVKQEGVNGLNKVTEKVKKVNGATSNVVITNTEEIKAATNEIVVRGGSSGTVYADGTWAWPTKTPYSITSPYGYRWGALHDGIDISGTGYGSPIYAIQNADLLIVAGTSLTVQPAASLINYFRGKNLILINKEITPYDKKANLVINEGLGKIFKEI